MKWLRQRVIEPEILDTLPPEAARASLGDLIRLNRDFGGHSALRHALREAVPERDSRFSWLDVGAASGDMGAEVRCWAPQAQVVSIDRLPSHLASARAPKLAGDAFALPFRDRSFDYSFSSLFLHHFTHAEIVAILREMRRVSRRAVVAVDLERHPIPYYFVPATRFILGWNHVTVNDAPISVAAGFREQELEQLAADADLKDIRVRRHGLSFRLTLVGRIG